MKTETLQKNNQEPVTRKFSVNDVAEMTGLQVIEIEMRKHWIICTLANGVHFWIRKW